MSFVRTYDTATASKSPLRHLLSIVRYPGVIWQNRFMVQNFLRRDLMGRFHGSLLGAYWLLMQPLFLFAVYYFVFGLLNNKLRRRSSPCTCSRASSASTPCPRRRRPAA
jgi:hypothetical protein